MQQGSVHCCQKNGDHKIMHFCSNRSLYWFFALLRLLLNFIPQTGYIHPDEFFQYLEVAAGDSFDIDVYKPWEYNVTFPIRNSMFPQLCVRLPYLLLEGVDPIVEHHFGISLKTPYFLVLFPRIAMTLLSFVSDYSLFKICTTFREPYVDRMTIFASSYVMLIYCTRTFSNSIEMLLSSALLYYVSRCIEYSNKVVLQSDYLTEKYYRAKNGVERTKIHKLRMLLPSHSLNDCLCLATLSIVGIFNRPTFIAFAFSPICFWIQRGLGSRTAGFFLDFHIRIFMLALYAVPAIMLLIIYDSFYFGYLTSEEIGNFEISINNFVVTPLNFLKYNTLTDNLKQHGLHPRFLHLIVNVPLLFNVLGIFGIFTFIKMVNSGLKGKWLDLPRIQSVDSLMMASFVVPVAILSYFPHQEPRFIIPVFLPLVFLFAHWIKSPNVDVVNIASNKKSAPISPRKDNVNYKKIWYISNVVLAIFYGFVHQGGILPLSSHLSRELKSKPDLTHIHLYVSHTYSLPTGLLQLRNTKKTYISDSGHKYKLVKDFYMNELGSRSVEFVHNKLALAIYDCERDWQVKGIPCRLYYALPYNLYNEFFDYTLNNETRFFNVKVVESFYPHLSLEKPPQFHFVSDCLSFTELPKCVLKFVESPSENVMNFLRQFSLVLLRIEPVSRR